VHASVDVSIAVATDGGLVTPVLRDVGAKRLSAIAAEAQSLAQRARDRRLQQHELEGGAFSVSNLGMYGTLEFSAIINPPQSGILAVGAAKPQPVVTDGAVTVATVMRCTDGILLDVAMDVAAKVTDIEIDAELVDNVCGQLVRRPDRFDVLVTTNQYGDILSDVAAGLVGGIGLAPGGNYGPDAALFEPVHGSALSHAGRDEVNPVATILSGALLLDRLGEHSAAVRIGDAIASVLVDGRSSTYDICRPGQPVSSTTQMVDAVIERLRGT